MVLTGYAHRIATDAPARAIIATEYADSGDPALLAAHCLEALDPDFAGRAREGDVLAVQGAVGGGEGAEPAVLALQAVGVAAVVCEAADAEFAQLAAGYGLAVLVCAPAAAEIAGGALVRVDLASGSIEDRTHSRRWGDIAIPPALPEAARRAQILARTRRVVDEEGFAE
jgi:3-isopropylmalate/(R)-2-methylmalate dehydratase small subunit